VSEADFLPAVTGSSHCVVHFFHRDFERCRILDKHLALAARKFFRTRFVKIHAPDAAFFVAKLSVKVLPCVVMFLEGKAYDRIVGFEEFGQRDDFDTSLFEGRLLAAGVVAPPERAESDEEEERRETCIRGARSSGDEDSDFD
jgi:thioredoxin-like negative regulator of GroEL